MQVMQALSVAQRRFVRAPLRAAGPPLLAPVQRSRLVVKASASAPASSPFTCPYSTLGVSPDADEAQIKRAYRKQALKWHPDVSPEEEEPGVKFLQLSEAYSFIMGKLGKGPDGSSSTQTDDWEFHDWYWSFRMSRTWGKNQAGTASAPPEPKPADQAKLQSQLAGLRHRAAVRAHAAPPKASPAACDAEPAAASASTADRPAESASDVASSESVSEEWADDWMDGPVVTIVGDSVGYEVHDASGAYSQTRRKFIAHQGTRDAVSGQLAGLRRKARLSNQHASAGYV
ncbi:hypothetical protein FOA52_013516 [Chlamydomonas sp. UWO 241]|nr:hypothetical protein FOA52_013516 [Chlamydomonas sp. UWO 241]